MSQIMMLFSLNPVKFIKKITSGNYRNYLFLDKCTTFFLGPRTYLRLRPNLIESFNAKLSRVPH